MVEAILEATVRVLAGRGCRETNTNAVAAAGVSVGSIYQYFANKDALVTAVHQRHARQMRGIIFQTLSRPMASGTLRSSVDALVEALPGAHPVEPELHRVLETEFILHDEGETTEGPSRQSAPSRVEALMEKRERPGRAQIFAAKSLPKGLGFRIIRAVAYCPPRWWASLRFVSVLPVFRDYC